jgi:hypothetical protein
MGADRVCKPDTGAQVYKDDVGLCKGDGRGDLLRQRVSRLFHSAYSYICFSQIL